MIRFFRNPAEKEGFNNLLQVLLLLTLRLYFKMNAPKSAPLNLTQFIAYIDSIKFKQFHPYLQLKQVQNLIRLRYF